MVSMERFMAARTIRLAINGAAGRMGQRLIDLAGQDSRFKIVCAIENPGHALVGKSVGPVKCTDKLTGDVDVVIDFSLPEGTQAILPAAVEARAAMVIGTTGLALVQKQIDEAAKNIPVVQAANYSVGVNALLKLVAEAARILGDAYDIEIVEAHHRFKKDAPSGTALALAKSICQATGKDMAKALRHGRQGEQPRAAGEIGMHALRLGDTVGEHAVHFGALGETVTLAHSAHTRDTFALGALRAAAWIAGKPAGTYNMADVLFGKDRS
jgi:4-hydroxy-tetrahydrodipicolinate reductase